MTGRNKNKSLGSLGERGFLQKILPRLKKIQSNRFLVAPGDDAAVLKTSSRPVLSIDGLTENTHFKRSWEIPLRKKFGLSLGRALGWKLMGSSLSDLAAMGDVRNRWAMVYLGGPSSLSSQFLMEFYRGVQEATRRHNCVVVGGDTVRADQLSLVSAVGGTLHGKKALTRQGARVGDLICVAGTVGDADRGLQILMGKEKTIRVTDQKYFVNCFFNHQPLFEAGKILSEAAEVSSLIDLSDSLAESLEILLSPQKLGCDVVVHSIPVSAAYKKIYGAQPLLLSGGEDYSLLFTVKPSGLAALRKKLAVTVIGQVVKSAARRYFWKGRPLSSVNYFKQY